MSIIQCNCQKDCTLWALIASVIIGIVTAFLRITAVITVAPAALIVAFGIAVVYLGAMLYVSTRTRAQENAICLCPSVHAVLAGALGTILTTVVLLAITFVATSILGAIITGTLAAAFAFMLTASACLAKCLIRCTD